MIVNPNGKVYGYIRVSTKEQNEDRQIYALTEYGVKAANIYMDKMTGSSLNRPAYKHLIRTVRRGDIIVIKSIDRLGRNYQDVIDQWRMITEDLGVGIHVIDMPTLNSSGDPKDLMSRFITDMMLQVLSFVAQTERENTLKRQSEGLAAKKRRGEKMGRKTAKIPKNFWSYYIVWRKKTMTVGEICEEIKISPRTFYRRIRELDRRYGDFPVKSLEKIIIENDIDYVEENNPPEMREDLPHVRKSTKNMRQIKRTKDIADPARPKHEIEAKRFHVEFQNYMRDFNKRFTGGYLIRDRERKRITKDAHERGMSYFEYLEYLVENNIVGRYCERKSKLPDDWSPDDPKPVILKYMTDEYRAQNQLDD